MVNAYRKWRKLVDKLLVGLKYYCAALLVLMLGLAFLQVVLRYFFNAPFVWSDEIVLLMLGWFAYPALVFNVWTDDHFNISSMYEKFPTPVKIVCDLIRHILIGTFCLLLGYFGYKLMLQNWPKPFPASQISQGLKFIPVVFGGMCSALFCVSNIIGTFVDRMPQAEEVAAIEEGEN